jgi:hypothetical protein
MDSDVLLLDFSRGFFFELAFYKIALLFILFMVTHSAAQMKMTKEAMGVDQYGAQINSLEIVALSPESSFQRRSHLWLGVRTGMCGE